MLLAQTLVYLPYFKLLSCLLFFLHLFLPSHDKKGEEGMTV